MHPQVIREGRPCHLYFDLECPAALNPGLDMDGLVNALLHHVDEALGWAGPGGRAGGRVGGLASRKKRPGKGRSRVGRLWRAGGRVARAGRATGWRLGGRMDGLAGRQVGGRHALPSGRSAALCLLFLLAALTRAAPS